MDTTKTEPSEPVAGPVERPVRPSPYRHFGGMCWPAPSERLSDCAHALAHAVAFEEMKRYLLVAASVITAYQELIAMPVRKRNATIRELRKGPGKA